MVNKKIEWIEKEYHGNIETIAMRRSIDGWRVVHPMKNKDGTINWRNIIIGGSYWNVVKTIAILLLLLLFFWVYNHDTSVCRETMENFGTNCALYMEIMKQQALNESFRIDFSNLNWTHLNITIPNETART